MIPRALYTPTPSEVQRIPPEFVMLSGNRPGTADAAVGAAFYSGSLDRHVILHRLVFRITISANAGAETRLTGVRVMLEDAGVDRGSLFELRTRDAAGLGLFSDNGGVCAYPAGSTGNQSAFTVGDAAGIWVPAGVSLRLQSFTGGGVPASHEIRWTAILATVPKGPLLKA